MLLVLDTAHCSDLHTLEAKPLKISQLNSAFPEDFRKNIQNLRVF